MHTSDYKLNFEQTESCKDVYNTNHKLSSYLLKTKCEAQPCSAEIYSQR